MEKETFKQNLKHLAVKLGVIEDTEVVSSKFEEVAMADESVVNFEPALEEKAVATIDVDGVSVPVEDGSYELADKRVVTIEGGIVSNIEEVPEVEEEMEEASEVVDILSLDDVKAMIDALGFNEVKKELETVKSEFKAYRESNEAKTLKNNEVILEAFKTFGEAPAEEVKKKKDGFNLKKKSGLAELIEKQYKK